MSIRRTMIVCFFVSLGFSASVLAAADEPEIIQAAKREGHVVWYTVAGESQQLAQEFERKNPLVKVEVVRCIPSGASSCPCPPSLADKEDDWKKQFSRDLRDSGLGF